VGDAIGQGGGRRTGVRKCRGTDAPPTRPWLPGREASAALRDFDAHTRVWVARTQVGSGQCPCIARGSLDIGGVEVDAHPPAGWVALTPAPQVQVNTPC